MSREALANAYEEAAALYTRLAEVHAQLAHELLGATEQPGPTASVPPPSTGTAPVQSVIDAGECPIHHRAWKVSDKGYAAFCTAKGTDPAWTNSKGYCRLTTANVGEYLRINGVAAA